MKDNIKDRLRDMIWKGISVDIFYAERSYALFREIGDQSNRILKHKGYGTFFGVAQEALKDQFLLAISRLCDRPSKRNPTRCIEGILEFMSTNIHSLPEVLEQNQLRIQMKNAGFTEIQLNKLSKLNTIETTNLIIKHYQKIVEVERPVIMKLMELRDKKLVHNENVEISHVNDKVDSGTKTKGPTFNELIKLIDHAKFLVGTIGWAYLNSAFAINGEYRLTDDALRPRFSLKKLIDDLDNFKSGIK